MGPRKNILIDDLRKLILAISDRSQFWGVMW